MALPPEGRPIFQTSVFIFQLVFAFGQVETEEFFLSFQVPFILLPLFHIFTWAKCHTSYSPIKVSRYTNWTFIIPFSAPQTLFLR